MISAAPFWFMVVAGALYCVVICKAFHDDAKPGTRDTRRH